MDNISQTKELSKDTYLSLSDKIKIKMNELQFSLVQDEKVVDPIKKWLRTETNHPYYFEHNASTSWVLFINEADAVAFKLRWM